MMILLIFLMAAITGSANILICELNFSFQLYQVQRIIFHCNFNQKLNLKYNCRFSKSMVCHQLAITEKISIHVFTVNSKAMLRAAMLLISQGLSGGYFTAVLHRQSTKGLLFCIVSFFCVGSQLLMTSICKCRFALQKSLCQTVEYMAIVRSSRCDIIGSVVVIYLHSFKD